jgi:hypothetical protein
MRWTSHLRSSLEVYFGPRANDASLPAGAGAFGRTAEICVTKYYIRIFEQALL